MGELKKLCQNLGVCSLLLLVYSLWQGHLVISMITTFFLAACFLGIHLSDDEEKMFQHNPSFSPWLLAHEKKLDSTGLDGLFCLFIESTPKGLYHAMMNHGFLDELYVSMMREMSNYFGTAHVKRLSKEQFVVVKEFPSPENLDFEQKQLYQWQVTNRIAEIFSELVSSCDEQVGNSIDITVGCASGGIRYRVDRIEDLLELAYFTMKTAQSEKRPLNVADEHIRARKCDVDECKIGFNRKGWENEFNPFFQPVIHPDSFRIIGMESVARWQLDGFRIIPATVFKDLAFEMNHMGKIDSIIIQKTFTAVKKLQEEGLVPYGFRIVLNLSATSLTTQSVNWLYELASEHELHPEHIEIDIKDSILSDLNVAKAIAALRDKGFRIALDAFDEEAFDIKAFFTSSFDIIKLDYSLENNDENVHHEQRGKVFDSLKFMGETLSMETLAKNIESRSQLENARDHEIDYLQGNYFTPPVPFSEFRNFMHKYREGLYLDAYVGASEFA